MKRVDKAVKTYKKMIKVHNRVRIHLDLSKKFVDNLKEKYRQLEDDLFTEKLYMDATQIHEFTDIISKEIK